MSSSGNNRFIILEERIKELNLSEEEKTAFRKAKSQVQQHSRLGALAGLLVGGYVSKIKKFTLGIGIAVCMGSITMGSQIGFLSGTAAGIRTIKSLPNSPRIFEAIKDVQSLRRDTPSMKNQEQQDGDDQASPLSDEFVSDNQDIKDNEQQQSSWAKYKSPPTPSQQPPPSQQNDDNYSSSWDKIRAKQASSSSTWDKIRQNSQSNQAVQQQQKTTVNGENIPRTSEDFEELYGKGKIRTNQYGDVEIINA